MKDAYHLPNLLPFLLLHQFLVTKLVKKILMKWLMKKVMNLVKKKSLLQVHKTVLPQKQELFKRFIKKSQNNIMPTMLL